MKKTKHFNISVPELGDVPDITQVSNAISDLEDATAGTLEIMKAEMQGTKITLTSVSRKTKRTGYYEGMSIRFKSPQDIEPNYLKTISVDGLGDQTLSVEYKVNRNEYIDIVYEGNKFTAYPVVVKKTDSVSNNSSILVGTAKGVKTAYDKGVEALTKANQAQSSANNAQSTADGKVSKNGDTMTGTLTIDKKDNPALALKISDQGKSTYGYIDDYVYIDNKKSGSKIAMYDNGNTTITAKNLTTKNQEVIAAINELNNGKSTITDDLGVVGSDALNTFPLTVATKGSIYYHKGTNRYYICIESYSGSSLTNPNANFQELSVYTNRQELDAICTFVSNERGYALKFKDGALICFPTYTHILEVSSNQDKTGTYVFPYGFIENPSISTSYEGEQNITVGIKSDTDSQKLKFTYYKSGEYGSHGGVVHYVAYGRWK